MKIGYSGKKRLRAVEASATLCTVYEILVDLISVIFYQYNSQHNISDVFRIWSNVSTIRKRFHCAETFFHIFLNTSHDSESWYYFQRACLSVYVRVSTNPKVVLETCVVV